MPLLHLHLTAHSRSQWLCTLPHLTAKPSSFVTVVDLVLSLAPDSIHPDGFGYLISRFSSDYSSSSLGILGTVFDSCALPAGDKPTSPSLSSSFHFTKLTVMLGGPYGSPYLRRPLPPSCPPYSRVSVDTWAALSPCRSCVSYARGSTENVFRRRRWGTRRARRSGQKAL